MGSVFVGARGGGEVFEVSFDDVGGVEGRGVDNALGEEKAVDKKSELGEIPSCSIRPGELTEKGVFAKDGVKGDMVRVWGREDSKEPNSGDVSGDNVVCVGMFDVVMSFGKKAFECG
jgi:hypothetical protein